MARAESRFVCQTCGASYLRWEGQCRSCESWNTLVETVVRVQTRADEARAASRTARAAARPEAALVNLAHPGDAPLPRIATGIAELDRVLGGGLVPGSLVLVGGEPGVGKSTLLLQAAAGVVAAAERDAGPRILYATGEESAAQVRLRAARLGLASGPVAAAIDILAGSEIGRIAELARQMRPTLVVVDSIQTMTVDELDGPAGSVGQVRESALRLMDLAKGEGIAVILVGHVTKDGSIAGPKTLEHLVDAVLDLGGERSGVLRLLRATKNRFGSTEEIGVFELGERGMTEVEDPGRAFLVEHESAAPGSIVAATMEGSRPLMVEVQALVAPAGYGTPARRVSGIDPNRLALILAVLGRRAGIGLGTQDVYANLAGGLSVAEPGLDLPMALALASSFRDRPIESGTVAIGEVGLLGELRSVAGLERRLREAARLGFRQAIVPGAGRGRLPVVPGLDLRAVGSLRDGIRIALGEAGGQASHPQAGPRRRAAGAPPVLG
ncbi:MAG TPA: DNA repair protein RadA [Candidatus Limnocylindrales bacterium]|nr:DNA repair protein RadA [Candidatus Limnocylindrales bacterium]